MKNGLKKTLSVFTALVMMLAMAVCLSGCDDEFIKLGKYEYEGEYSSGSAEEFIFTAYQYKEPQKAGFAKRYYYIDVMYTDPYGAIYYGYDYITKSELEGNKNDGETFTLEVEPLNEDDTKHISKEYIARKISVTIEKGEFFKSGSMVLVDIYSNYMLNFHDWQYVRSVPKNRKTPSNQYCDGCGLLKYQGA